MRKKQTSRGKRCAKYQTAILDILNQFTHKADKYYIAWNKTTRKYAIYRNNKKLHEYGMDIGWAMENYWELKDKLQPSKRKTIQEPIDLEGFESDYEYPDEIRIYNIIHDEE